MRNSKHTPLTRLAAVFTGLAGLGLSVLAACSRPQPEPEPAPAPAGTAPAQTPTPEPAVDPLPTGVVNALIYGTDSREKTDYGGNTDSLMLAQISANRKGLTLVSVARDTWVPIRNAAGKINSAYSKGGVDLLVDTASAAFGGIDIHLTAHTNFNGFINITRWLEGIRVFNKNASRVTVQSTGRVLEFQEGELLLENTDALIYARQRKGLPLGDLDRAERHRALVTGMLKGLQAVNKKSPAAFKTLAGKLAEQCKISGIETDQIPDLGDVLMQVDTDNVTSLMLPITGYGTKGGASVNLLDEARAKELGEGLAAGDVSDYVKKYGSEYAPTGG